MNDIEILIALVAAAIVLVRLADAISIPYPIVLVLGGLGIGFIPGGPALELQPDVVFLVFLPPLLQSAGYWASPKELRAELDPAHLAGDRANAGDDGRGRGSRAGGDPSINWAEGFVLGAIVAPTDPVAAIAIFQRVGVANRVATLVEGESMINDAVALVSYKVAVVAVVSGTLTAGEAIDDLVIGVIGGVAIGLAVSGVSQLALRRLDDAPLAILLTVFTAYASFALADGVGASGVLAAVSSGLFSGWRSHLIFDADMRLNAQSFWRVLVFALNAILFVLVGEQFPEILRKVGETFSPGEIVGYGLMVSAVVVAVRVAWQFLPVSLGRLLPKIGDTGGGENWRERLLIGWTGMRGAVSLAAALALPFTLDSGATFDSRDLIVYLTVAVIFVTLVGQGLTLPPLVTVARPQFVRGPGPPTRPWRGWPARRRRSTGWTSSNPRGRPISENALAPAARALPGALRALRRRPPG